MDLSDQSDTELCMNRIFFTKLQADYYRYILLDFPAAKGNKIHSILIDQHSTKAEKIYSDAIEMMD